MPLHVSRNFFGAQIASFEQHLPAHESLMKLGPGSTYRAVFIRAPAILSVDESKVIVLSKYKLSDAEKERSGKDDVIVAAQFNNMLVTAFHPELTDDCRWCAGLIFPACATRVLAVHESKWSLCVEIGTRGSSFAGISCSSAWSTLPKSTRQLRLKTAGQQGAHVLPTCLLRFQFSGPYTRVHKRVLYSRRGTFVVLRVPPLRSATQQLHQLGLGSDLVMQLQLAR